eukprot:TRINITY_DN67570_c0_g1_i1.p2 TRINITY_DN67570_c0_g1~~TRINITY_DN67570_c0_g1_i1.p2  ORF type:complete len:167 (+),score=39.81 TRINITY_DN67570_c0_g1_i1:77-502(+)
MGSPLVGLPFCVVALAAIAAAAEVPYAQPQPGTTTPAGAHVAATPPPAWGRTPSPPVQPIAPAGTVAVIAVAVALAGVIAGLAHLWRKRRVEESARAAAEEDAFADPEGGRRPCAAGPAPPSPEGSESEGADAPPTLRLLS